MVQRHMYNRLSPKSDSKEYRSGGAVLIRDASGFEANMSTFVASNSTTCPPARPWLEEALTVLKSWPVASASRKVRREHARALLRRFASNCGSNAKELRFL